jgi:hypothetical protein
MSPQYRAYVNNELFTERTWIWRNEYLEECLQIFAPPGKYNIRYELVDPLSATLQVKNLRVINGPGVIVENNCLLIKNEN